MHLDGGIERNVRELQIVFTDVNIIKYVNEYAG
jgi:hypothetical protein